MTIHLPADLESSISAAVHGGHFASADELVAEAVRSFLRQPASSQNDSDSGSVGALRDEQTPDPIIGSMRDAADELDEIVADAYRQRREDQGRVFDLE